MPPAELDTDQLLDLVGRGDQAARGRLLDRHRQRLRNLVALRMDPRLAARVDPSDVVQESLAEADRRLSAYLRARPLPFYPWLRQLALERLIDLHRRHVRSQKRSVRREEARLPLLPDDSLQGLARLAGRGSSPSGRLRLHDLQERMRAALERLAERDREVLLLRHFEQLAVREIAAILGISEGAVKVRHVRALERLRQQLDENPEGFSAMIAPGLKTNSGTSADAVFAELVEELTAKLQAREPLDVEAYLARYPEQADRLRPLLPALQLLGALSDAASGGLSFPPSQHDQPLNAGTLGDFRIVREVGRGGMAVVYEAEQISLGRRVALKVLPLASTLDPRRLQRFHNEAKAAACLHHTNIVPVFAVGSERGVHFYAMQLIDGVTLASVIHDLQPTRKDTAKGPHEGPATTAYPPAAAAGSTAPGAALTTSKPGGDAAYFRKVAELGATAAEALDHAHQLGVVHRDVKPANLLLDGQGTIWVTDFGLAQLQTDAGLTVTGDLLGTLRYMSPEQALAKRMVLDHRTDVYSLGATLYELLTFRPVFAGDDRQELLRQIAFDEPLPPRRLQRTIPAELETIVLKALEKKPRDRYATAQELADDLRRHLEDKAILARRPSWRQVAAKWARRHKAVVGAAAVVLLVTLLFGCGIGVWWLQQHAAAEQRRASAAREAESALSDADRLQNEGKLPEAMWALRRAEPLRTAGLLNEDLAQRVGERQTDLEMLDRIEDIRLKQADWTEGHFDTSSADPAYERAFQNYGIDVLSLEPKEAAERIKAKGIRVELAAALQDWAMLCRKTRPESDTTWMNLLAIARVADPDDWRNRLRDALERKDKKALTKLADSEKTTELSPISLVLLGTALKENGAMKESAVLLRKAQRQYPGDFWITYQLTGSLFVFPQQPEEVLSFARAALALRPHNPDVHLLLGRALSANGQQEEAIEELLKAHALDPKYIQASIHLGRILENEGRLLEAEEMYRKVIALEPKKTYGHVWLIMLLEKQGRFREEMAVIDQTALLEPRNAEPRYRSFGYLLYERHQFEEAKEAFRKASALKPQTSALHCMVGIILSGQGQLEEAKEEFQKAVQVATLKPDSERALNLLRSCDRLLSLRGRLPALLSEEDCPANQVERLEFAFLCATPSERRYALATRLYADANVAEKLAGNGDTHYCYLAACAAARAGCGQGKDADQLNAQEGARLRKQALDWLRADLTTWRNRLEKNKDKTGPAVRKTMQYWLDDTYFNCVRGAEALAKLPEAERGDWQRLWEEVAALRQQAQPEEKQPPIPKP